MTLGTHICICFLGFDFFVYNRYDCKPYLVNGDLNKNHFKLECLMISSHASCCCAHINQHVKKFPHLMLVRFTTQKRDYSEKTSDYFRGKMLKFQGSFLVFAEPLDVSSEQSLHRLENRIWESKCVINSIFRKNFKSKVE